MRKLRLIPALFAMVAFVVSLNAAAIEREDVNFVVNVRGDRVDTYIVNDGFDDLGINTNFRFYGLGRSVSFVFFREGKKCAECKYRSDEEIPYTTNPGDSGSKLLPTELKGNSFAVSDIAESYGLKKGCYTFYAVLRIRTAPQSVSNVARLCLDEAK